ncbi:AcaB family transcriptional regulator [Allochromatium vinosum]|uniref:AcaB family transcriptional regulator n=1 Tax=Allochromatium vinosum TaxID=1049 RepID=UPI0019037122|nr:AcaB family transcriptional regulator [Allochromatium vinosum]
MTPDPDATPTTPATERAAPLADDTPARTSDPNAQTTPRRTRRPYRHSRPVFDRPVRIHSEYARRLVSERQFRPAMTALYGLDVILRLIATEAEADQVETVIATRLSELSQELVGERERLHAELERYDLLAVRPRYTQPIDLRVQIASPHIGAYTNLILELDQLMMAIDTLWLSGVLSNKEHTERQIAWRNRLGAAGQSFIDLHRYAYAEAERRGQREAVDRESRAGLQGFDTDEEESEEPEAD